MSSGLLLFYYNMSKVDQALIEELLAEREQLLAMYPELRPFQRELDQAMAQAGSDPTERLKKMFSMITDILNEELMPELKKLKELNDQTVDSLTQVDLREDKKSKKRSAG